MITAVLNLIGGLSFVLARLASTRPALNGFDARVKERDSLVKNF